MTQWYSQSLPKINSYQNPQVIAFCGKKLGNAGTSFSHTATCDDCMDWLRANNFAAFEQLVQSCHDPRKPRRRLYKAAKLIDSIDSIKNGVAEIKTPLSEASKVIAGNLEVHKVLSSLKPYRVHLNFNSHILPDVPGVYFVCSEANEARSILYVGKAKSSISSRWAHHHRLGQFETLAGIGVFVSIYCLPMPLASENEIIATESHYIKCFKPTLNQSRVNSFLCRAAS